MVVRSLFSLQAVRPSKKGSWIVDRGSFVSSRETCRRVMPVFVQEETNNAECLSCAHRHADAMLPSPLAR